MNRLNQVEKRNQLISQWIKDAGENIKQSFNGPMQVEQKSNRNDLVTELDKETEKELIAKIQEHFPGERIVAEESQNESIQDLSGILWIIDPIDGTLNFVKQKDNFAIMVAVYEDGVGQMGYIYDVMRNELYVAIKGLGASCNGQPLPKAADTPLKNGLIAVSHLLLSGEDDVVRKISRKTNGVRMIGSAGIESVYVSRGKLIAYIAASLAPWDMAAAKVFAEELGLLYTNHHGEEVNLLKKNPVIMATPKAHAEIIKMLTK